MSRYCFQENISLEKIICKACFHGNKRWRVAVKHGSCNIFLELLQPITTSWVTSTDMCSLIVLETRGLKSERACAPSGGFEGVEVIFSLRQLLVVSGFPWPLVMSPDALPSSSHHLLCVSPSLVRTLVIGLGSPKWSDHLNADLRALNLIMPTTTFFPNKVIFTGSSNQDADTSFWGPSIQHTAVVEKAGYGTMCPSLLPCKMEILQAKFMWGSNDRGYLAFMKSSSNVSNGCQIVGWGEVVRLK